MGCSPHGSLVGNEEGFQWQAERNHGLRIPTIAIGSLGTPAAVVSPLPYRMAAAEKMIAIKHRLAEDARMRQDREQGPFHED